MKTLLSSLVLLLWAAAVLWSAAPKPPPKPPSLPAVKQRATRAIIGPTLVSRKLSWTPSQAASADLSFRVYHATNIVESPVNWVLITNVPSSVTNIIVQIEPAVHFYSVKSYSAFWELESGFSPVAETPPAPLGVLNLSLGLP